MFVFAVGTVSRQHIQHSLNSKGISFQSTFLPIVSVLSVLRSCISCKTTVCPSNSIRKVIQSGQPHWPVILSSKCILLNDNLAKHSIRPTHPIISLSLPPQSTAYSNMLIPFLALSTSGPSHLGTPQGRRTLCVFRPPPSVWHSTSAGLSYPSEGYHGSCYCTSSTSPLAKDQRVCSTRQVRLYSLAL